MCPPYNFQIFAGRGLQPRPDVSKLRISEHYGLWAQKNVPTLQFSDLLSFESFRTPVCSTGKIYDQVLI